MLSLKHEMRQGTFMFRFLALATMNFTHGIDKITFIDERKLSHMLMDLGDVATGLWYALDSRNGVDSCRKELSATIEQLKEIVQYFDLPSPDRDVSVGEILSKGYDDPEWGTDGARMRHLETRVLAMKPTFAANMDAGDDARKPSIRERWFGRVRRYKLFYGTFWVFMFAIFLSFAIKIDSKNNLELQGGPALGGFGVTFLPVPPQYTIGVSDRQTIIIPLVYGVMHTALFCLGLLPIPMCRGMWRDLIRVVPAIKLYIPVDDFVHIHRQLGFLILTIIVIGATLWLTAMVFDCKNNVENACLAFEPAVNNFFDPIENVLMLRFVIWSLWFTVMPLMYWARSPPPRLVSWFKFGREKWYEICYYSHVVVAHATLSLALIARFEVFYPVLVGWGIYWIDSIREIIFSTKQIELREKQIFARSENGIPTSMHLKFEPKGKFKVGAGQHLYLQVPEIDYTWHPFSLCSASSDSLIQLHIGICTRSEHDWSRGKGKKREGFKWTSSYHSWTYKLYDLINTTKPYVKAYVRGPYGSTFTSCFDSRYAGAVVIGAGTGLTAAESVLRETIHRKKNNLSAPSKVWFVYSCRKEDDLLWCWDRVLSLLVGACVDGVLNISTLSEKANMLDWIGLSMYVTRSTPGMMKQFGNLYHTPEYGSQITSKRLSDRSRVQPQTSDNSIDLNCDEDDDDLSISRDLETGALDNSLQIDDASEIFTKDSAAVSVAEPAMEPDVQVIQERVKKWLLTRILSGSLQNKSTHIERYLKGVRSVLDETDDHSQDLTVCFCGPSPLAVTISEAVYRCSDGNTNVEFSVDHQ